MWNSIKERLFPLLITLSALSVSASAAFYSVTGLSKLFAGASLAVIIMAASLEIAKLVMASLLYQYRKALPKLLKTYLTIAVGILILITSAGIYGFLSDAYQTTANKESIVENQINLLETKKTSFEKIKGQYEIEKTSLTQNITTLRNALGNNIQSYVDNNGNVISYSSGSNRKAFEKQLEVAIQKDEQLTSKIQTYNDSIISLETRIVETQSTSASTSELGPLKYLSNLTGVGMDKIINVLLLIIIFVFDPLAIALVIAANFAFEKLKKKDYVSYPDPQVEPESLDIEHNLPEEVIEEILNGEEFIIEDSENDEELEEASLVDLQYLEKELPWEELPVEEPTSILETKIDSLQEKLDFLYQSVSQVIQLPQESEPEPEPEVEDLQLKINFDEVQNPNIYGEVIPNDTSLEEKIKQINTSIENIRNIQNSPLDVYRKTNQVMGEINKIENISLQSPKNNDTITIF